MSVVGQVAITACADLARGRPGRGARLPFGRPSGVTSGSRGPEVRVRSVTEYAMRPLPSYPAPLTRVRLIRPAGAAVQQLQPTAPALEIMTDFAADTPHVVTADRPIDEALHDMIVFGVRLLLVVQDADVLGVITSYDIQGERPIQFLHDPFRSVPPHRHVDVTVGDVMTTIADLRPLRYRWVVGATVGDIAGHFRATPDTHLLVAADDGIEQGVVIRGVFSRTRLERQLGGT